MDAILKLHEKIQSCQARREPRGGGPRGGGSGAQGAAHDRDEGAAAVSDDAPGDDRSPSANPDEDLAAANLPGRRGRAARSSASSAACSAPTDGGDTSGYGGLVRAVAPARRGAAGRTAAGSTRSPTSSKARWRSRACSPATRSRRRSSTAASSPSTSRREHLVARRADPARRPRPALRAVHRRQRRALPATTRAASCTPSTTCARSPTTG